MSGGGGADAAEDAVVEGVLVGVEAVEGLDGVDGEVGEGVAGSVAVVGVGEFPQGGLEGGEEEDGGVFVVLLRAGGEASDELVVAGVVTLGEGFEDGCGCPSGEVRVAGPYCGEAPVVAGAGESPGVEGEALVGGVDAGHGWSSVVGWGGPR